MEREVGGGIGMGNTCKLIHIFNQLLYSSLKFTKYAKREHRVIIYLCPVSLITTFYIGMVHFFIIN